MNSRSLPDMATQTLEQQQPLDWVGMTDIALPVRLHGQPIAARAATGVSLDNGGSARHSYVASVTGAAGA